MSELLSTFINKFEPSNSLTYSVATDDLTFQLHLLMLCTVTDVIHQILLFTIKISHHMQWELQLLTYELNSVRIEILQ